MLSRLFWKSRSVLITGHTGFKGSWMLALLKLLGARVTGFALSPPTEPCLYNLIGGDGLCNSIIGDVRDFKAVSSAVKEASPDIVIHMAAQPLVIDGYNNPAYTFETNVMGTVNVLEAVRNASGVKAVVNVTTDKVYENRDDKSKAFTEDDRLGGFDPYSSSKVCSEAVSACYTDSFFCKPGGPAIASVRSGNVLGGGDFAKDRLIPDCIRAALGGEEIVIRNGGAVRPWQHVLEPVAVYLAAAQALCGANAGGTGHNNNSGTEYCTAFNVGPDIDDCMPVIDVIGMFCSLYGEGLKYRQLNPQGYREAGILMLNAEKAKRMLGFKQQYKLKDTLRLVVEWTKAYKLGADMLDFTLKQSAEYLKLVAD